LTRRSLEAIRLLVLDVDGVLTDGTLVYGRYGEELKGFFVRDGIGVRLLLQAGLQVAVLSGRRSEAVAVRCHELGMNVELVLQGSRDKAGDLDTIEGRLGLVDSQVAAMGDDITDLPLLSRVGFAACPADAAPEVAAVCHPVCRAAGGHGAVREVAELLLKAQDRWDEQIRTWTQRGEA
jgi:3-deoxy-D-manno-octulosonate 8-phosphate phosphatase (KDO 8-P phosphatase)